MNVTAWRRGLRAELIARRLAIARDAQRRSDQRIGEFLILGFPMLERVTIGFYWPFNAEVDPRVAVYRFRSRGARTALPVVVEKHSPLEFRSWEPGIGTVPGVFGLPVPKSPVVVPDALLMPLVGFDACGYRLGYGGGYFDRTLAGLSPQPHKIGLARAVTRVETIHPQPYDIPMDFVITEEGIHAAGPEGLRIEDDFEAVAARVEAIREARLLLGGSHIGNIDVCKGVLEMTLPIGAH